MEGPGGKQKWTWRGYSPGESPHLGLPPPLSRAGDDAFSYLAVVPSYTTVFGKSLVIK